MGTPATTFGDVLQKFVENSPATVMVRGLLDRLPNPEALDRWLEATAQAQYTSLQNTVIGRST